MPKKYLVYIQTHIDISNAEKMINYVDQGWNLHELDAYHSYMVRATTTVEVETDSIKTYIKALEACNDFTVLGHEEFSAK